MSPLRLPLLAGCLSLLASLAVLADDAPSPPAAAPSPAGLSATGPFSPEEALQRFQLHPACRIELVAAEPDVLDPVHIAFDDRARLWVVEYSDYPNGPTAGQPGLSRIRVLTDADADGRYDQPVLFADKLLFATGLLPWRDGVIVTTAGAVLFLRDTDGDGRADESQEWFVGFKEDNPQLRANHPTLSIDNHIYIASGLRGGDVRPGRDWARVFHRDADNLPPPASLSGRDFRFDPLTGDFEAVSGPGQFGLSFDDWGRRFVCDNRHPCKHIVFEESDLRLSPHVSIAQTFADALPAGEESRLFPISRTWTTSNLHANQFTAACGLHIARGDALPPEMQGQPFVCDPTANLVHHARFDPHGATFSSHRDREEVEFLATTDEWCRPVNLTTGPDGALYMVDMYRAVIEHPQFMPDELKQRPDLLLGMDKGRIYRIVAKDARPQPPVQCVPQETTGAAAVELLKHPCGWQRELGQRRILEAGDATAKVLPALLSVLQSGDAPARAQALWLLARLTDSQAPAVRAALADSDPRVQEQATRIVATATTPDPEITTALSALAAQGTDPRLRFVALLALGTQPVTEDRAELLARAALDAVDDLRMLAAVRLATHDARGVTELIATRIAANSMMQSPPGVAPDSQLALLQSFAELAARQSADEEVAQLLARLPSPAGAVRDYHLAPVLGVCQGLKLRRTTLAKVLGESHPQTAQLLAQVFIQAAENIASDQPATRNTAIALLEYAGWDQAQRLLEVAGSHPNIATRKQAVEVLARRSEPEIGPALVENLAGQSPEQRNARVSAIFASTARIPLLLDEIEAERLSPRLIDAARVKQLTSHRDEAIRKRAAELFASLTPAERKAVLAQYQSCLELGSDPARGREVFKSQCSTCHRIGDLGVNVAPDISDSRTKTREYLLTSILDPNQAIDNNYFSYTIMDVDGVVYTGVLQTETATSVTLVQPEGKTVTLPRDQIELMKSNGVSLMPEGLERNITPQQMADLISFIKNWRYLDGSVPQEVIR